MGHVSAGYGVRLRKDDPSVGETKSAGEAQGRLRSYCDIGEIGFRLRRLFQELSRPCPCEGVGVYVGWERPRPKAWQGPDSQAAGKVDELGKSVHGGLVGKGALRGCQGERARF